MTERSRGLPSPPEVIELLSGDFERAGYEIDDVSVNADIRPPQITVVADGDSPLDLDAIAALSRTASDRLDALPDIADSYVLEVTSPGVERPLTTEKHFRRARGRRAELTLTDGTAVSARIGDVRAGVLRLVTREGPRKPWSVREIAIADIVEGVVQVEFSPPSAGELDLLGDGTDNGTEG